MVIYSLKTSHTAYFIAIFSALMLGASVPAGAVSQSDIVWPTYATARHPGDTVLDCQALEAEIHHVVADLIMLDKAKLRVEDVLHSAFDLERYGKTRGPGGQEMSTGAVDGKENYAIAREQIVFSLRTAGQRRDWLQSLRPACKTKP